MARLIFTAVLAAIGGTIACSNVESPTDLVEEGPPMIRQVFMKHEVEDPPGSGVLSERTALAFGTHPDALSMKSRVVSAAPGVGQTIRIVMDELLVGNYLEEILCRGPVDEDAWSTVPIGATPDDIANCAVQPDVLPQTCTGDKAVCIDAATGAPVGVMDQNGDGAADDTQFIPGAVSIECGSFNVPLDLQTTYWQPSGNQQVPAIGGVDNTLGPAIIITTVQGLPVSQTCQLVFGDAVVDKAGIRPCAPQFGDAGAPDDVDWPPPNPCPEGDTSATQFTVNDLVLKGAYPTEAEMFPATDDMSFSFNTKIDPDSFATLTITPTPAGAVTTLFNPDQATTIGVHVEGGLNAGTDYTISFTPMDLFGLPSPAPIVINFTAI